MTIRVDISVPITEERPIDIETYIEGQYQHTEAVKPGESTIKHVWKGQHLIIKEWE